MSDERRRLRINGRRGAYLLFKSAIFVGIGLLYIVPTATTGTERSLAFLLALGLPVWAAGIPWLAAATIGIAGAFTRGRDHWAFAALTAVAAMWTIVYLIGWIVGASPRGHFLALVFGMLAGATYTVAGMLSAGDVRRYMRKVEQR